MEVHKMKNVLLLLNETRYWNEIFTIEFFQVLLNFQKYEKFPKSVEIGPPIQGDLGLIHKENVEYRIDSY